MRRLRFGSVHFGKKREKRLGDGNACGTEILDARFTYAADALDSGVAFPEERLDRFRGLLLFSGGKVHADFIQNAHFPGGVRQIPGFVAVLLPTVADAHDRTLKNKGEVKDDARKSETMTPARESDAKPLGLRSHSMLS